jgi:hypothetical protein
VRGKNWEGRDKRKKVSELTEGQWQDAMGSGDDFVEWE